MSAPDAVGLLHDDAPYLKVGQGPPLVSVPGLSPNHEVPQGFEQRMAMAHARPLARHFTVYVVNRKRGLRTGESMADIAGHLANAIEHDIGEPVFLEGTSTGGSVALQLAVDRPDLVRRLVVISAAYRLGADGRALQAEIARLIRSGESRQAWAKLVSALLPGPLRTPLRPVALLVAGRLTPADPQDVLVTLAAEDAFDVGADLPRVSAPTLVIGGSADQFYPPELFEATAAGIPDGRCHLFPGWGHLRASGSTATSHLALGFLLADRPPL